MTITPPDFSLISGFSFPRTRVPLVDKLVFKIQYVRKLINPFVDTLPSALTYVARKEVVRGLSMPRTTDDYKVHIQLWLVICGMLRTYK